MGSIRTQLILWPLLELLVCHQLFNAASHCLNMVDDQFVKISVRVLDVNDELASRLTGRVGIGIGHICILMNNQNSKTKVERTNRYADRVRRPPSTSQRDGRYPWRTVG